MQFPHEDDGGSEAFLEDEFIESTMSEIEQRALLEKAGRIAADITIDLQEKGPLYLFVRRLRDPATAALLQLAEADAHNPVTIARLQATVKLYLESIRHIHQCLASGADAERTINEQWGPNGQRDTDLFQPARDEPAWRRR
jgi:hypothetical protein